MRSQDCKCLFMEALDGQVQIPTETSLVGSKLREGPRTEDEVGEVEGKEETSGGRQGWELEVLVIDAYGSICSTLFRGRYFGTATPLLPVHSIYEVDSIPRSRNWMGKARRMSSS